MNVPTIVIPRPVQFVLDDVGWREGWDLSQQGGPWRAGVNRLLGPEDYHAVADIGEALGIRPQCAMVLCEWDKENVCAQYPTATHLGRAWDNSSRIGPWADQSARIFADRAAHIEFAMHGVGHEHWDGGVRTRAEWLGRSPQQQRWPWDVLQGHLECFRRILAQYDLDPAHGVSFPPSFVPCAFCYYWDNRDPESTGALMKSAGVRFCSTPYSCCTFAGSPADRPDGGFDHGLIVLDRGNIGVNWFPYATVPKTLPTTSICGIHWPNVLMPDPMRNGESVRTWVDYLAQINRLDGWMLARNMAENCSQWLFHHYAELSQSDGRFILDAAKIPNIARENGLVGNPILKVPLRAGEHVSAVCSDDCRAVAYWEQEGAGFLALRLGKSRRGRFEVELGAKPISPAVWRKGTYDVMDIEEPGGAIRVALRVYGRQTVHVRMPFAPSVAESASPHFTVHGLDYDRKQQTAAVVIASRNIHGEEGEVVLRR